MADARLFNNKPQHPYSGYDGLNVDDPDFSRHVMRPREIVKLFSEGKKYKAEFAYPKKLADGFEEAPVFTGTPTSNGLELHAHAVTNTSNADCAIFMAWLIMPAEYIATDRLLFRDEEENGFGSGSFEITSLNLVDMDNNEKWLAKQMVGVENRPGLFLKVANGDDFYEDIAIFFPAQVGGLTHKPVEHGEAFVLVGSDVELTDKMVKDIHAAYEKLIKKSYGEDSGLYEVDTHRELVVDNNRPMLGRQ